MGRKKPAARDEENAPAGGGGKSKKKGLMIDDDEYSVGTELSEETQVQEEKVVITGKKKGKKGNQKNFKEEKGDGEEEEVPEVVFAGKKKSKGKKSGAGGNAGFSSSNFALLGGDEDDDGNDDDDERSELTGEKDSEEEDEPVASLKGKTKGKGSVGGGSLFSASAFDAIDDGEIDGEVVDKEEDDDDNGVPVIEFTGKKKKSAKGGKKDAGSVFLAASFDGLDENEDDEKKDEDEDFGAITFSGKKKSSKSSKKSGNNKFSAALLDDENDEEASVSESVKTSDDVIGVEDEDESVVAFTGKKKKSSKKKGASNHVFSALGGEDEREVDEMVEPEEPNIVEANDSKVTKSEAVAETSKNKKKKKGKSGRTAQEEDDLDKILAELGGGASTLKPSEPPPQEEKLNIQPEPVAVPDALVEKEGEEEKEESAAAKKKKKKKEKEKEKKVAAAAATAAKEEKLVEAKAETSEPKKTDAKGKAAEKKLPKHVREMQEALARRKEMEERKAREEEDKRRKEEEERLRQEELERQAEEARRRKKEREKEKLLKKKQEGKLLTGKQKEEQRRLEAMRNQILANAGITVPTADRDNAPTKRPRYQTKKSKPAHHQANGIKIEDHVEAKGKEQEEQEEVHEVETVELDKAEPVEEEKTEVASVPEENGMEEDDDDEEWDAKSWDDVNLNVKGAFDDEEDSEPEPVLKKETKSSVPASRGAAPPSDAKPAIAVRKPVTSHPMDSSDVENKKIQTEVEVSDKNRKKDAAVKNKGAVSDAIPKQGEENLRSPICCIMGHVDTGKTKLLDCIRGTNVQEGEAGGITQQIGATYFPAENIRERTKELKADAKLNVPGLLVIDTPGHESFTNLRSRGSGLCDIAILVVDIMHGLEPQTIESLNLLRMRNTEFIVALNKVDRLYAWKAQRNAPIRKALKQQSKDVQNEFDRRLIEVITQFKEQGLNTELYYKNKDMGETFNIVPTSAITGEGIPDLLLLLIQWSQKTMIEKLTFRNECTVLEVKVIEGHGTTIDVVLVNGVLHEGDQIVGPIVTTIRALLTPHPMKELRVKVWFFVFTSVAPFFFFFSTVLMLNICDLELICLGLTHHCVCPCMSINFQFAIGYLFFSFFIFYFQGTYLHHKEIKAAQGIKITGQGLEHAIAGTGLYVVGRDDDVEDVKESAMEDMKSVMSRIDKSGEGVYVQASTLGSLEALLEFLKSPAVSIPVSGIGIGPVHKKDVMKSSVMLEKKKEYATILAFDVKVTPEARELADELGVKIFIADIIYHLFDQFKAYIQNLKEEKKKEAADEAVFPCVLEIIPECIFNKKDPIILGVDVLEGILKVGTPLCVPQKDYIDIGRIASIEFNKKSVDYAKKGQKVAIKIVGTNAEEQQKMHGRHFDNEDQLVSHITRRSIDILKVNYRDDLSIEDWRLVVKLKTLFKIQ
ncbi:hypothetical protein POTOM_042851 [Populus tomentosa]|uniref:Eukaryotic translation initiation factor 5B n=1 Tax=Populus tomentosa TaxID=118781 RepID=A0A8X7YGI5_POPTO|nr:hypothetical protein POTOM_042851 [Populus tomentosa]